MTHVYNAVNCLLGASMALAFFVCPMVHASDEATQLCFRFFLLMVLIDTTLLAVFSKHKRRLNG
jgi:hypothetical protein